MHIVFAPVNIFTAFGNLLVQFLVRIIVLVSTVHNFETLNSSKAHRNIIDARCQDLPEVSALLIAPLHLLTPCWALPIQNHQALV